MIVLVIIGFILIAIGSSLKKDKAKSIRDLKREIASLKIENRNQKTYISNLPIECTTRGHNLHQIVFKVKKPEIIFHNNSFHMENQLISLDLKPGENCDYLGRFYGEDYLLCAFCINCKEILPHPHPQVLPIYQNSVRTEYENLRSKTYGY